MTKTAVAKPHAASSLSRPGTARLLARFPVFYRNCPVCGAFTEQHLAFEKLGFNILRCGRCKLGRTDVPAEFNPAAIYTDAYFQGGAADGYCDYPASGAILRREFRRTLKHLRRVVSGGRLLEVGCAYGFFLDEARGWFESEGIEVSVAAAAACRQRGLNVSQGTVESVTSEGRKPYDAVVMLDVIEHLADPAGTLEILHRRLSPGGGLLITTGDWQSLLARSLGRHWRLMTPPQHLFFFSRRNLILLLQRLGFSVVRCVRPWKWVPLGLAAYQVGNRCGWRFRSLEGLCGIGLPLNLFDAVQIVARKTG